MTPSHRQQVAATACQWLAAPSIVTSQEARHQHDRLVFGAEHSQLRPQLCCYSCTSIFPHLLCHCFPAVACRPVQGAVAAFLSKTHKRRASIWILCVFAVPGKLVLPASRQFSVPFFFFELPIVSSKGSCNILQVNSNNSQNKLIAIILRTS